MATKDQERKALAQIMKIVAGLGEDSYIGMAFEGCFEDAAENIENDWGCSQKQRADATEKKIKEYQTIRDELVAENKELKKRSEEAERLFNLKVKTADSWCAKYHETLETATENWNKYRAEEDKVEALQMEVIKLKARLFDMMEAQGA